MSKTFTTKEIKNLLYEFRKYGNNRAADCIEQLQAKLDKLETENKDLKKTIRDYEKHCVIVAKILQKDCKDIKSLQAELDKAEKIINMLGGSPPPAMLKFTDILYPMQDKIDSLQEELDEAKK